MIITVLIGDKVIGAIQSLDLSACIHEDAAGQKLTVSRMKLDKTKIAGLFSKDMVQAKAQFVPIQIMMEDDRKQSMLKIHNAWFETTGTTYTSGDWIILEGVELMAETVSGSIK